MWMLVRAGPRPGAGDDGASPSGVTTLAGCPDTPGRGDPWRWTARLVTASVADDRRVAAVPGHLGRVDRHIVEGPDGAAVELLVDPDHVDASVVAHSGAQPVRLTREAGSELVVVPLAGEALVTDSTGPWRRSLRPGDVFVVEGQQPETLLLIPAPEPSMVAVLRLAPTGDQPLRWVP